MLKSVQAATLILALAIIGVLAAAPAAVADGPSPVQAATNAAFAQALRSPIDERLPNPVQMSLGGAPGGTSLRTASTLPAYYFDDGRLSPVKNQGFNGSCWAFANIAALESALLPAESWDFSEDNLVTRSGFGPFTDGPYDSGGIDAMAVAYFTRWAGPVTESDDPYPTPTVPAVNVPQKHVQDVVMLPGRTSVGNNGLLKRMAYEYGAVSVGMYWREGAYRSGTSSYYDPYAQGENHGVCIVGWDDSYSRSNFKAGTGTPPGDGAFIARNSWGADFGDNGYFYVSYYDRSFAFEDCTVYTRVDALGGYGRVYQYDKLGLVDALRPTSGRRATALFANRFTATASANVTAVGFYATTGGATYKVLAGPTLRSLTTRASGTIALPGFHTVALDADKLLPVAEANRFVVAVRLSTPGGYPIPVETRVRGYSRKAQASRGQSYVRPTNTTRWKDLTRLRGYSEANVCLKAYTD